MNKNEIISRISGNIKFMGFKIKQHSPEILIVAGVVGTIASAVLACRATLKVVDVIDEAKETLDTIHKASEKKELKEKYSEEDAKKDTAITYIQTGLKVAKVYAVPVTLGVVSIGCMVASNKILRKRNIALVAAYETLNTTFKKYRTDVIERFGDSVDKELRYGIKAKTIQEVDEETGEVSEKTVTVVDDPNHLGPFVKIFDETCAGWRRDADYNMSFLKNAMSFANNKLRSQHYLFLNDVYEMLGMPKTSMGQTHGWIYDEDNPIGDNYVDFGIYNLDKVKVRDFINGYEQSILLEFNCDGYILDHIWKAGLPKT